MPTLTSNTNALRRIRFAQLTRVLDIRADDLRAVIGSPTFPRHQLDDDGQATWRVADVATWLDANGWPADAAAVRRFVDDAETALPSDRRFRSRRVRAWRGKRPTE